MEKESVAGKVAEIALESQLGIKKTVRIKKENLMAKVKAEVLKEKIKAKALQFKKEIQETVEEFKATHEDFKGMSNQEIEAFVVESFNLLYDEIDEHFKFPKMVDLAAKEMLITEGVDALFDRYVEKD